MNDTIKFSIDMTNPEKINPLITRYKCYICTPDEPANNFIFSKDVLTKMSNTILGCAVVAGFMNNEDPSIVGGHEDSLAPAGNGLIKNTPKPQGIGFADPYVPCWFEEYKSKEFLTCYVYLWTGRYPELDNLAKRDIHQSMEVQADYTEDKQYKIVTDAIVLGLCMLENVEPAFEDSTFVKFQKLDNESIQKDINSMKEEFNKIHKQIENGKKDDITNFPKNGDNKEISLDNSQYKVFDLKYAEDLKANYPSIWKLGGNIQGNSQFDKLSTILNRKNKEPINDVDKKAIKEREVWSARHYEDYLIKGVVAQIKWLLVGSKGEKYMKDLIEEKKSKIDDKKTINNELKKEGEIVNNNDFAKDELGSGDYSITINKSKEALSTKPWGEVDKTAQTHKVFKSKNVKTVVNDIYALVEADWENAPSQHLKYPIMEVKANNEAVYNRGALKSALGYAKAQNETSVVSKVMSIYKTLGLNKDNAKNFEYTDEEYNSLFENKKENKKGDSLKMKKKDKKIMAKMTEACKSQKYKKDDKEMCKYSDVLSYDDNYMYAVDMENCKMAAIPYAKDGDKVKPDFTNCKMGKIECSLFADGDEEDGDCDVTMALKKGFTTDENTEAPANVKRSEDEAKVDKAKVEEAKKKNDELSKKVDKMQADYSKLKEDFEKIQADKKELEDKHKNFEMDTTIKELTGILPEEEIDNFKNKIQDFAKIEDWSNAIKAFAFDYSAKNFTRVPLPEDKNKDKKGLWD